MTYLTEVYLVFCKTNCGDEMLREVFALKEEAEEYIDQNKGYALHIVTKELQCSYDIEILNFEEVE